MKGSPRIRVRRVPEGLGSRVRKARHELGLSLAAVSGKDFSRAFLNQVELGRARPSTRTLQIIAERLGKPIEYFLHDSDVSAPALELALTEGETRLHRGDAGGAESLLVTLLKRRHVPTEVRTRAQLLLADALLRRRAADDAVSILEEAIRSAERAGWKGLLVDLYDRMGLVHYQRRRLREASNWFDKALREYDASQLADPVLRAQVLGHRANIYYFSGSPGDAIAAYEAAIAEAEQVLDMKGLAGMYEGLAVSLQRAGDLGRALSYAQKSLRIYETLNNVRMSAQLHNNMADMLLQEGRHEDAERLFTEGAVRAERIPDPDLRPYLLSGAAEAALEQGALDRAKARIAEALAGVNQAIDPLAKVAAERVAGRVAHVLGQHAESRAHFERALQIVETIDSPQAKSRIAYDYARALEAQGDTAQAATRFREAYEARTVLVGA